MATERAHTSADDNGAGLGGARGGGPSRRADRDLTTGLRLRVGAAGASAGRGSRREAGYLPAAGASRRGRDDYFVELTLGQSIVLVLVLLLAHVAGAHPSDVADVRGLLFSGCNAPPHPFIGAQAS
jgi:hypothetical protein